MPPGTTTVLLRTYGYGVLAGLLVVYLVLVAFLDLGDESVLSRLLLAGAICVSVVATTPPKRRLWLALPLALVAIINLVVVPAEGALLRDVGQLFMWYLAVCLLADVLGPRFATSPKLLAAVCLYVVAALGFASIYNALDAPPAGDKGASEAAFAVQGNERRLTDAERVYFSFVTQTTLGYGDIVPVSQPARAVAIVQATGGVLYLAVLVAAIVSGRERQTAEGT